jgi:hypothetical protein
VGCPRQALRGCDIRPWAPLPDSSTMLVVSEHGSSCLESAWATGPRIGPRSMRSRLREDGSVLRGWFLVAALFAVVASGCGGDGDDAATGPTTGSTAAEVATTQPSPQTTETPEREEPPATPVPTSGADEATPVPTSGAGVVLPITGWQAVGNGTNLWANELVLWW